MELDALLRKLAEELKGMGIPVSAEIEPQVKVNTRAKRRLGCCIRRDGTYTIEVSSSILDEEELLRQTLVHELLHTCYGCGNHGARWKAYAKRAGEAMGLSIERTCPARGETLPLRQEEAKYLLECQSCGARIVRMRLSKAVKAPWRYRCKCGGRLKRIQ